MTSPGLNKPCPDIVLPPSILATIKLPDSSTCTVRPCLETNKFKHFNFFIQE